MRPRRFREAFAEEAGRSLGSFIGALPMVLGMAVGTFGPEIIENWHEHRARRKAVNRSETDSQTPKDSAPTRS